MRTPQRITTRALALGASLLIVALAAAAPAHAGPGSGPTAAVSLGDSYISGQAGRWLGNATNPSGDRDGTDRGCVRSGSGCSRYDRRLAYVGASASNGCHRSNVAEVVSATIDVAEEINLACSDARITHLFRRSAGGQMLRGEAPQADQLALVARTRDVRLVALTIGGNDLGFGDIVRACVARFLTFEGSCRPSQEPGFLARLPTMRTAVGKVVDEVRGVMRAAGYKPWHYRIVLHSYPSVAPRASEVRYPEAGLTRGLAGNCPFYNADFDWARDGAVVRIANALHSMAVVKNVQFLDLRNAFQGREVCSTSTQQAAPGRPPTGASSEWGRFFGPSSPAQGDIEESFHPNAFGQMALGRCLTLTYTRLTGSYACVNQPGRGPEGMTIRRISPTPGLRRMRVRVRPRRAVAGRRTCFRVRVTSGGLRVERATVRFASRRRRTGRLGRVRRCARLRAGVHRVRVRRTGFRAASARVRVVRARG